MLNWWWEIAKNVPIPAFEEGSNLDAFLEKCPDCYLEIFWDKQGKEESEFVA